MATTILHPTAGFILDIARGAEPGPLSSAECAYLRRLAEQVRTIAAQPKQQEKRDLWYRHNHLESKRPLLLVFPEDSWAEILGEDQLELSDPFWRQQEWYLRHLIYRDQKLPDDFVIEWGFGVAQEFVGVGPRQHAEFLLDYQLRLLEQCGLVAYGCCEPYTHKFAMLARIPRLRRVSVSPWCDVEKAAASLEDRYILSWKANPAMLIGGFDSVDVRRTIRRTLDVTEGCVPEIILKDTFTLEGKPTRLEEWCRIARAEIERE